MDGIHSTRGRCVSAPYLAIVGASLSIGTVSAQTKVPEKFRTFDAKLSAECAAGNLSGVVSVTIGGTRAYTHTCGMSDRSKQTPITIQSRFKIFSITKMLTGVAVMTLIDRGKLAAGDSAKRYLPDLPRPWRDVTIRELLEHTSGVPDLTNQLLDAYMEKPIDGWSVALKRTLEAASSSPLLESPGSKWRYNNFGYELLADVIQRVTGKEFPNAMRDLVFEPAAMRTAEIARPRIVHGKIDGSQPSEGLAVGYACKADGGGPATSYSFVQYGAGSVYASADDFEQLDRALRAGQLLSPAMQRASISDAFVKTGGAPYGYGLLVREIDGKRYLQHDGGNNGYVTDFARGADTAVSATVLSNDSCAEVGALRKSLMAILLSGPAGTRPDSSAR